MNSSVLKNCSNPREEANVISKLFFWWTRQLYVKAYHDEITLEDLYEPLKTDRASVLGDNLEMTWLKQLKKLRKSKTLPNLTRAIYAAFWKDFLFVGIIHTCSEIVLPYAVPVLLGLLLQTFKLESSSTIKDMLLYAGGLVTLDIARSFASSHLTFELAHLGLKIRIALNSLAYRKALRLSKTVLGNTPPGKIVNLMAHETCKLDYNLRFFFYMWSAPIIVSIVVYFVYLKSSYAGFIGIAVIFLLTPIQVFVADYSTKLMDDSDLKTEERVRLMTEIVSGIQVIKMYAWEKPFISLVETVRKLELKIIRKSSYLRETNVLFNIFTARIALYSTLITMFMLDQNMTSENVYVVFPFLFLLSDFLVFCVRGVGLSKNWSTTIKRVQTFLMLDEYCSKNIIHSSKEKNNLKKSGSVNERYKRLPNQDIEEYSTICKANDRNTLKDSYEKFGTIEIKNVNAAWNPESIQCTLNNTNLKFGEGKLYIVVGLIGSGKSSLLSSILGEITIIDGQIKINGTLSYAAQEAWIFGDTIRQNILFGEKFDVERYERTVEVCSLLEDFRQLPQSDLSIVGEKGISLSGGQKARINLARAIYRKADIYLLDDPLSAVDAHVGKHLFEECIMGLLRNKTRILVTHQLQYMKYADVIILLDQGVARQYTSYHQLLNDYPEYESVSTKEEEKESADLIILVDANKYKGDVTIINNMSHSRNMAELIEKSTKGVIRGSLLLKYFRSGSSSFSIFLMCLLFIITQSVTSLNDFFVYLLTSAEESRYYYYNPLNSSTSEVKILIENDNLFMTETYLLILTGLVLSILFVGLLRSMIYVGICMTGSENLHNCAFNGLIKTNIQFFHNNPSGRILNRFSQDVGASDFLLCKYFLDTTQILLAVFGAFLITCILSPIFIIPAILIFVIWYWTRAMFLMVNDRTRRFDGMTKSPIYTHLNETLNGMSIIRAYNAQEILKREFDKFQDLNVSAIYCLLALKYSYGFFAKLLTSIFTCIITFAFVILKNEFNGRQVGFAITQMFCMTTMFMFGTMMNVETVNNLTSIERLLEYKNLPQECQSENKNTKPKKKKNLSTIPRFSFENWPNRGCLEFKNVFMRYSKESEYVLKGINFLINEGEKVGIVGRTGAGKSSIISALFRLTHIEGIIEIDGIDTQSVPLETLRSRISIIPQDPILFSGSIRRNLDPLNEFSDNDLWDALDQVELKESIMAQEKGLNCYISDKGSNYSVGQRQLVCLARAILRRNKILVLDEATANVDPQTDSLIQQTIRTKFDSCTVLTVAHRLNTIIDSDKVLVMDKGCLTEFDHPYKLLQRESSQFATLVKETGETMYQRLFNESRANYKKNK